MAASRQLVVVDELRERPLRPAARRRIELVGEHAHGDRDGDAFDVEIPLAEVFPVEPGAGHAGVRHPCERDVVEDVVARQALGFSAKDTGDHFIAARVVIEEVRRQPDRRIGDAVQRLRPQPHLVAVGDALLIDELQSLVGELLVGRQARRHRRARERRAIDLGWKDARHVDVNAQQLRSCLHSHQFGDDGTPIAALRRELLVAEALHERDPRLRDARGAPARLARLA